MKFISQLLTRFYIYSVKKKRKYLLATNSFIQRSHSFAVLLPENESDFLASFQIVDFLISEKKNILLIFNNAKAHHIHQRYSLKEEEYYQSDIMLFGLPTSKYRTKLSAYQCDAVIDLSRDVSFFHIASAYAIQSKIVIGFEKVSADKYYTVQIKVNQDASAVSYKNFLNCLQMF